MIRVGKTLAASATLAWLFLSSTPLSAADMSTSALNGDTYDCPAVAPEDPDALAEYEAYGCADYNLNTGAVGETAAPTETVVTDPGAGEAVVPPDGEVTPPPGDGGGVVPPVDCPPGSDDGNCVVDPDAPKGNNGVGNGVDPQPPGNPPINDAPGTSPGNPGNKGGAPSKP